MLKKCVWCGKVFETNKGTTKRCDECLKLEPRVRKPKKQVKPILSIKEVMHIAAIYDVVNGTKIFRSYSKISEIIKNTKPETCVCCGDTIPEGRMVCPVCEGKYNNR